MATASVPNPKKSRLVQPAALAKAPHSKPAATAKPFQNGRSQAVRLPKEFQFEGTEVLVSRTRTGVLLEPISKPTKTWAEVFVAMDTISKDDPMPGGRNQGITRPEDIFPEGW